MRNKKLVEMDLLRLGYGHRWFGAAEFVSLPRVLMADEKIERIIYGIYPGGPALLVATDRRLLLIDKAPLKLIVEDFTYDSISSVECITGLCTSIVRVHTRAQNIEFRYVNKQHAQDFTEYLEKIVMAFEYSHQEYKPVQFTNAF